MSTLGQRLKELRLSLKLTQTAFAERVDLTAASLSRFESGRVSPSPRTIAVICSTFGISRNWLENGVGEMLSQDDDQAMAQISQILHGDNPTARAALLSLANMPPEFWEMARELLESIYQQTHPTAPDQ